MYANLDEKDKRILDILVKDSSLSTQKISSRLLIPITTVHNRIRKLRRLGVIRNYTINIDHDKLGKGLSAYILINIDQKGLKVKQSSIGKKIKQFECVETVDIITGTTDIIIKVREENMKRLNDFITNKLRNVGGVDQTQTMMVLEEI